MDREEIESLIARVAFNEIAAFNLLHQRVHAKLFLVCLRVLNVRAEAEDALQDTFLKIWRNASRYSVNGLSPMTWLIKIARNTSIDHLRARRKGQQDHDTPGHELLALGPDPEKSAVNASELKRLSTCLEQLEKDCAAAIRGVYLDGCTYVDMADRFSVPLNTMRTRLRRGLLCLRLSMSDVTVAGRYNGHTCKGRKPTAMAKADEVKRLKGEGIGATEIANRVGIGRASVYRILRAKENAAEELEGTG